MTRIPRPCMIYKGEGEGEDEREDDNMILINGDEENGLDLNLKLYRTHFSIKVGEQVWTRGGKGTVRYLGKILVCFVFCLLSFVFCLFSFVFFLFSFVFFLFLSFFFFFLSFFSCQLTF